MGSLSVYMPESFLTILDNLEFLIRIVVAAALGALVGLERTRRQKEAGIRTHCIIACSAAVFMILSKYAFLDAGTILGAKEADPARIAAQVVSGISFLGAGVIFKNGNTIKGLTTAAGIWATAAIGMAIGAGMYWVGIFETAVLMLIQLVLHRFPIGGDSFITQDISISMNNSSNLLDAFEQFIEENKGEITKNNITMADGEIAFSAKVKLPEAIKYHSAIAFMQAHPGINSISV